MSNWVGHLGFRLKAEVQSLCSRTLGDAKNAKTDVSEYVLDYKVPHSLGNLLQTPFTLQENKVIHMSKMFLMTLKNYKVTEEIHRRMWSIETYV